MGKRGRRWLVVGVLVGLALAACSLNPQPIPPGAKDDGGVVGAFTGDAASRAGEAVDGPTTPGSNGDSGATTSLDASPPSAIDADGAPPDASTDAPSDALIDAPSDANDAGDGA